MTLDVLKNDSDPDGDALSVFVLSGTANGALETGAGETLTYAPDPEFTGTDSFAYIVRDGHGGFDVGKASITVAPDPNRAPNAEADHAAVAPGGRTRVDVLANDADRDGDTLDVTILDRPDSVNAHVAQDGSIVVAAGGNFDGADSLAYTVSDAAGETDQALLHLRVPPAQTASAGDGSAVSVRFAETGGAFGDLRDDIGETIQAAWSEWSQAFTRDAEIELDVQFAEGDALASARPGTLEKATDPTGLGRVLESGVIAELKDGLDTNGDDPDGIISIHTDPSAFTWRTERDAPVAGDTYDGLTLMAHEIGHVLGFTGFHDESDGHNDTSAGGETAYDAFVEETDDGAFVFDGPAARAVNDGPVALGRVDPFHLADPDTLMASGIAKGETREISEAEFAMLQDIGAPVALGTGDVDPVA